MSIPDSPIKVVLPNSLEELFNKNPDDLTDADVEMMLLAFRNERARWNADEKAKKMKPQKMSANPNLKLEDLDL